MNLIVFCAQEDVKWRIFSCQTTKLANKEQATQMTMHILSYSFQILWDCRNIHGSYSNSVFHEINDLVWLFSFNGLFGGCQSFHCLHCYHLNTLRWLSIKLSSNVFILHSIIIFSKIVIWRGILSSIDVYGISI